FKWNGEDSDAMSGRLFVIHTYNSMLIKLLAAEIVSAHGLTSASQPAQAWAAMLDNRELMDALAQDVERGHLFAQAGIRSFVEEATFCLDHQVGPHPGFFESFVPSPRRIFRNLALYRTDPLSHSRDVLRDLYQRTVPGKLRESLGE